MKDVAKLEAKLTSSDGIKHINDIRGLFECCESSDLTVVAEALQAIPRVLNHHRKASCDGDDSGAIKEWLLQHYDAYYSILIQLATSKDARAQVCALRLFMAALQHQDAVDKDLGSQTKTPEKRFQMLLTDMLLGEHWSKHIAGCLNGEFIGVFIDIRHFALCHLKNSLNQVGLADSTSDGALAAPPAKKLKQTAPFADLMRSRGLPLRDLFKRALEILRVAPEPEAKAPEENGERHEMLAPSGRPASSFLRDYRRLYQDSWLQLLSMRVPMEQRVPLLQLVPVRVMPHLSRPLQVADFYLRAFNSESLEVSVMALSGLFVLLTKHSLGDPETLSSSCNEFYAQLYSLIRPETFLLEQRARFQRLLAASLGSGLLPARFAAAFAKKCMCVAATVADAGTVMWLISVTYTLIQRNHSHCKYLIHKEAGDVAESEKLKDCFNVHASLTDALDTIDKTSLWELKLLERHHIPAVATLLQLFSKPFFKPSSKKLDPDLFLDQSVERLYKQAMRQGERQAARWKMRGEVCPLAFNVNDDELHLRLNGWAAALSTSQRRLGAGL